MPLPPSVTVCHGDALELLRDLPDELLDACVTDPPYGLAFMGKHWDKDVPPPDLWAEVLRVLKPGAHLLAFAGTRTVHRMGTAIEDAGFQIRDMIAWVYASGFPKSLNVTDAVLKFQAGQPLSAQEVRKIRDGVYTVTAFLKAARDRKGWNNDRIDALFGTHGMAGHWVSSASQPAVPSLRQWAILKDALGFDDSVDDLVQDLHATERPDDWGNSPGSEGFLDSLSRNGNDHEPHGAFGTALKPALEPVILARKPPQGTMAQNIQTFGTGALSIDACRIPGEGRGRFPTNLIHDGEPPVLELFPKAGAVAANDSDPSAARLFFCAKASQAERRNTRHPTVKPLELLRYLVRLVTLPGHTVLDPFAGTGTTGEAALAEGRSALLFDREAAYVEDMRARLHGAQLGLFHGQINHNAGNEKRRLSPASQSQRPKEPENPPFLPLQKDEALIRPATLDLRAGVTLSDKVQGSQQEAHAEHLGEAPAELSQVAKNAKSI